MRSAQIVERLDPLEIDNVQKIKRATGGALFFVPEKIYGLPCNFFASIPLYESKNIILHRPSEVIMFIMIKGISVPLRRALFFHSEFVIFV